MPAQYLTNFLLSSYRDFCFVDTRKVTCLCRCWLMALALLLLSWSALGMANPADVSQITTCLNALVTAQDAYFAVNGRYTQHDNLLATVGGVCDGVMLTTFTDFSLESGYFITGRIDDTAYNATPDSGITQAVPMQTGELGALGQLATCLRGIAYTQGVHFIDFSRYGNYADVVGYFVDYNSPNACDGVDFTEQSVSDDDYLYLGDVSGCVLQVTPLDGVSVAQDDGCPQTFDFFSLIGTVLGSRAEVCLKEIAISQELYIIDFGVYTTYAQLIDARGAIDVCEGVALTERNASDDSYSYIARVEGCAFQLVSGEGISALYEGGCPQRVTFGVLEDKTVDTPPFMLMAFATSRLPVTFTSVTPAVCEVSGMYGEQVTLVSAGVCGIHADQAGNDIFQAAKRVTQRFVVLDDEGAEAADDDLGSGTTINPEPDMQIRNGDSLLAETITSRAIEPLRYGTFKRGQAVGLNFLVRNPGQQVLEIGELVLPSFLTNAGEALPETLGSFASVVLSLEVDTSTAGQFTGQISLESNDPDAFENPFVFDVVISISDEPANALYVLPGVDVGDVRVSAGQTDVPLLSFYVSVPAGSVPVTVDRFTLAASSDAVARASELRLYIDGGTRGVLDSRDVRLSHTANTQELTFNFAARTFLPETPMWFLLVGDF